MVQPISRREGLACLPQPDRAMAVHVSLGEAAPSAAARASRAEEFQRLIEACDCLLVASCTFHVRRPLAATLFGRGQVREAASRVAAAEVHVVFVDHPLSPVQQRNLEQAWGAKVVDRTGLILEIFAKRARTREGALQVELASLNYQISRLVRSWTHLERQRGGYGFLGGPGERQIELDRRLIRNRIRQLEKELAKVKRRRATQRAGRRRKAIPTVALVGYTNAGKSTLFNRLTASGVYAADQLFATLDPTLRKVCVDGGELVLSDTVGFVQDLPHELVDAFAATLEEVTCADLILHVRDAADPMATVHGKVVLQTLARLGLVGDAMPPLIEVWNKVDLAPNVKTRITDKIDGSRVAVSALTGEGVAALLSLLREWLGRSRVELLLRLDAGDGRALAFCHEHGQVLETSQQDGITCVRVRLKPQDAARFTLQHGIHRLLDA